MASGAAAEGSAASRLVTLKRRPQFLRTRKGARWATAAFVVEAMRRDDDVTPGGAGPRFGFTVSKQVGKAVDRNRIRRRLRSAVRDVQMSHARRDFDYVVIARRPALTADYRALVTDLVTAMERVHRPRATRPRTG